MIADSHVHTAYSLDSETKMELMIERAITLGMKNICFTDHMDMDFPEEGMDFTFDTQDYEKKIQSMRKIYENKIEIRMGVELGLQPHLKQRYQEYLEKYPFDYVIGSIHLVNGMDPYYDHTFAGKTDAEVFRDYFVNTLENIKAFHEFDSLGHLDYVVRYGREKQIRYSYQEYADIIDEILRCLIENGKALELNTAGIRKKSGCPNPHPDILKRFRQLGGEMITIGSDAHNPVHLGYAFSRIKEYLQEAGFGYYTIFSDRKPLFIKI